ncbi:MAG: bifunctional methionine sulfoxide reductase B/A protein [Parashewanella sp.]
MSKLTEFEKYVIEQKGTEPPFSGEYTDLDAQGVYLCKKCQSPLYRSEHKFQSHCGWPSFDDEIEGAIKRCIDADGKRIEIVCNQCDGHLGHVFEGEMMTDKNVRHCVNSVSMTFEPVTAMSSHTAHLATLGGGCFWCLEAIFERLNGVNKVTSGYAGGVASDANYQAVCTGMTGHAEVVQIEYDPQKISYEYLLAVFFEAHDPTTYNQQGNDKGPQYRSAVFAHNAEQAAKASEVIAKIDKSVIFSKPIVTELTMLNGFYPAEVAHNDYYKNNSMQPYCQLVIKPKVEKIEKLIANGEI